MSSSSHTNGKSKSPFDPGFFGDGGFPDWKPSTSATSHQLLPLKPVKDAINELDNRIKAGINGNRQVLRTRWKNVNKALTGGYEFNTLNLICGLSGHGKSYFNNLIRQDFLNVAINSYKKEILIVNFLFETKTSKEMMRSLSGMTGIEFERLVGVEGHQRISGTEYKNIKRYFHKFRDPNMLYIEQRGNRHQIVATIKAIKSKNPDKEVVVTIDHSLLVERQGESEVEGVANLAKDLIEARKEVTVFLLHQLNDKILDMRRRDPAAGHLHFPNESDLFGSKQMFQAADSVTVVHQPSLLNMATYGPDAIHTQDLFAIHILKNRDFRPAFTTLHNNLGKGTLDEPAPRPRPFPYT